MTIERVNPAGLARPSGFSHAVVATGGRIVFLAGQTAAGADGQIAGETVTAQFERALGNLLCALREAGGAPEHLASLTIYAVDLADYRAHAPQIGAVWRRLAGRGTRRWRRSASAGCGTPPRWWRSRGTRSSPDVRHRHGPPAPRTTARRPGVAARRTQNRAEPAARSRPLVFPGRGDLGEGAELVALGIGQHVPPGLVVRRLQHGGAPDEAAARPGRRRPSGCGSWPPWAPGPGRSPWSGWACQARSPGWRTRAGCAARTRRRPFPTTAPGRPGRRCPPPGRAAARRVGSSRRKAQYSPPSGSAMTVHALSSPSGRMTVEPRASRSASRRA